MFIWSSTKNNSRKFCFQAIFFRNFRVFQNNRRQKTQAIFIESNADFSNKKCLQFHFVLLFDHLRCEFGQKSFIKLKTLAFRSFAADFLKTQLYFKWSGFLWFAEKNAVFDILKLNRITPNNKNFFA